MHILDSTDELEIIVGQTREASGFDFESRERDLEFTVCRAKAEELKVILRGLRRKNLNITSVEVLEIEV